MIKYLKSWSISENLQHKISSYMLSLLKLQTSGPFFNKKTSVADIFLWIFQLKKKNSFSIKPMHTATSIKSKLFIIYITGWKEIINFVVISTS